MQRRLTFPVIVVLAVTGAAIPAQQPSPDEQGSSFSSQTTNVLVPALVRDSAGKVVYTLQAGDFVLTDDGVPEKLMLQHETGSEELYADFGLQLKVIIFSGNGPDMPWETLNRYK
jgi:hypothetical protein